MKIVNNYSIYKKIVLLRVDLNVPVKNEIIIDNTRINIIKPTIDYLRNNNNKVFLLSHFGRPQGQFNNSFSLKFLCQILAKFLSVDKVYFASSLDYQTIEETKEKINDCEICLLENVYNLKGI